MAHTTRELFYLTPDGTMMVRSSEQPDATSKFGGTRVLFNTLLSPPAAASQNTT